MKQDEAGTVGVAIDFETADYGSDSACAVGLARIEGGRVTDTLYHLICPPRPSELFVWVHGLTWPMLRGKPSFAELWPRLREFMAGAAFLVAHNASFDRGVLFGCLQAMGGADLAGIPPFLCTLKGARASLGLPRNRLSDVCACLGIELEHHHAGSDALAAAQIYLCLRRVGVSDAAMRLKDKACRGILAGVSFRSGSRGQTGGKWSL